jgi:hypothetical protein
VGAPKARDRDFATLLSSGAVACFDIQSIATELARIPNSGPPLRVLFDWSALESWPFQAPSPVAIANWKCTAPSILRAAFLHVHKWDRQAALLSALLRLANAEAQSFQAIYRDRAISWLCGGP